MRSYLFCNSQKRSLFIYLFPLILFALPFLSSCIATKTSAYFKTLTKDTTLQGFISADFESKIAKNDVLSITVSSMNKEMDERFNIPTATLVNTLQPGSTQGYIVNERGSIFLHYVDTVKVEGLTRAELKAKLEKDLLPYMKEPIISVLYINHKITILGEVARPQVINMPEEQLSLIDVIVASGDVKENASRNNILVIREENNTKQIKHINLEDHSIFTSPWYYVKPNDIVYVLPDAEKYVKEENRRKFQTTFSLVVSAVSLVIVILNAILR
jgi:polysaccharide biosynthesis/export protein